MQAVHIGTSGYSYDHWKGRFYPESLRPDGFFAHYARFFDTVEINYSFYHIPTRKQVASWKRMAPEGFLFSLKAPKKITHTMRLQNASGLTRAFIWQAKDLAEHLGIFLFQLPPSFAADLALLEEFLSSLPLKYRYAFEFRHDSWLVEPVYVMLRERNMALCLADNPDLVPPDIATADFVYFRMHGHSQWVNYCYSEDELRLLAARVIRHLDSNREVFVYFNNDANVYAVANARRLQELLLHGL